MAYLESEILNLIGLFTGENHYQPRQMSSLIKISRECETPRTRSGIKNVEKSLLAKSYNEITADQSTRLSDSSIYHYQSRLYLTIKSSTAHRWWTWENLANFSAAIEANSFDHCVFSSAFHGRLVSISRVFVLIKGTSKHFFHTRTIFWPLVKRRLQSKFE